MTRRRTLGPAGTRCSDLLLDDCDHDLGAHRQWRVHRPRCGGLLRQREPKQLCVRRRNRDQRFGQCTDPKQLHRKNYGDGITIASWSDDTSAGSSNIVIDGNSFDWSTRQTITLDGTGTSSQPGTIITNNVINNEWGYGRIFNSESNTSVEQVYNVEAAYNVVNQWPSTYWDGYVLNLDSANEASSGGRLYWHGNAAGAAYGFGNGFFLGAYSPWTPVVITGNGSGNTYSH